MSRMLGKKHSPETKEKIRKAHLGKVMSPEARANMRKPKPNLQGYKQTQEHKEKVRQIHIGSKRSEATRKLLSELASRRVAAGTMTGNSKYKRYAYQKQDGRIIWLKASYEPKVAAYLDKLGILWEYELDFLILEGYDKAYLPDFFIFDEEGDFNKFIEVKGYFPEEDRIKFEVYREHLANIDISLELWDEPKLRELGIL